MLTGCPRAAALPTPEAGQAPLERALSLWGASSLSIPTAADGGYDVLVPNTLVDRALADPLALPAFAEDLGRDLDAVTTPSEALRVLADRLPAPSPPAPPAVAPPAGPAVLPSPTELLDSPRGQLQVAHLPPDLVAVIRRLCVLIEALDAKAPTWTAEGGPPAMPRAAAEEFFIERDSILLRARSHPAGPQAALTAAGRSLRTDAMIRDTATFLEGVEAALPALRAATEGLPPHGGTLLRLETRLGPIVLGGTGDDRHRTDAALLIDPGGDDVWENNAGSNLGVRSKVALAIDLGGSDRYEAKRAHTQGAGVGGVGVLIDAGPEPDQYRCSQQCQGAGFLGVGVVWDQGGDDTWEADQDAQGAGTFGLGLLLDSAGRERMAVRGRGQGFASAGGVGALLDLGGDDQRRLGVPGVDLNDPYAGGGQGAAWGLRPFPGAGRPAVAGGLGLLYDRAGRDGLYARAFAQGEGWFGGLGLLLDRAGDDRYITEIEGQGAASHHAVGLLLDSSGDDVYEGTARVQGAAQDASLAILLDRAGDDTHAVRLTGGAAPRELGPGLAWAAGDRSLALVVDEGGDDRYAAGAQTMGWALPSARPDREPHAALLDLGGTDRYALAAERSGAAPSDGAVWLQGIGGIGIDQPSSRLGWEAARWGEAPPPAPPAPVPDLSGDATARWLALTELYDAAVAGEALPLPEGVKPLALGDPSPAVRRQAARVLAASGDPEGVDVLVDSLPYLSEDNDPLDPAQSLVLWLGLLTGEQHGFDPSAWRTAWAGRDPSFDLRARWAALAGLIRARRASASGDVDGLVAACTEALDRLPHEGPPRRLCGGLVNSWAQAMADPSSELFDPARAAALAQDAVVWAPDRKEGFLTMARALLEQGEASLAAAALDQAEVLDSDDPVLLTLRRRLDGTP